MKWDNIPRLARSFFKTPPPAIVVVFRSICRTVSSQSFPQSHCFYFLFSLNCGWGALRQLHPLIQHLWTSTQSSFYPWDQLHLFRTYINCLVNSAFGFTAWNIFLECTEYLWEQFYQLKFKHVLAGGGGDFTPQTLFRRKLFFYRGIFQPWLESCTNCGFESFDLRIRNNVSKRQPFHLSTDFKSI